MKKMVLPLIITILITTAGTWATNNFFHKPKLNARGQTEKEKFESGLVALAGASKIYDVWFASPPPGPEGNVTASVTSLFIRTSGNAPLIYAKESGTANTGWAALAESGGSGSNPYWGCITGTLSNQSDLQSALNGRVPTIRSINGHALSTDVNLTKSDVGLNNVPNVDATILENISQTANHRFVTDVEKNTWNGKQDALGFTPVPETRTVNGHAFSSNVTVTKSDVDLSNVTDDAQLKWAAGDHNSFAEKVSPVSSDILLFEDSGVGYAKKKVQLSGLPEGSGTDSNANHGDAPAELSAIPEKVTPASVDLLLIEYSGSGYAKKKVRFADLPGDSGGEAGLKVLGERNYSSLAEAKSTIGNNHVTLIVPAGTYNISSDPSYPSNIELLVLKGAIFNIANNVTMTINGPFRAGNNRHFTFEDSRAKVRFAENVEVNAVWFTSGGEGSASSPWVGSDGQGGIGEAITHCYSSGNTYGLIINLPKGGYRVTSTINCNRMGIYIKGSTPGWGGELNARTCIYFAPATGGQILFKWWNSVDSSPCWWGGLSGIHILGDNVQVNTAIDLNDISEMKFEDITIRKWPGTGIYLKGREISKFHRIKIEAGTPLRIGLNPVIPGAIDCDAMDFQDLHLCCTSHDAISACITFDTGVAVFSTQFSGHIGMLGGNYGVYWNDTTSKAISSHVRFSNMKFEPAGQSWNGWMLYIRHNYGLRNLVIDHCSEDSVHRGGGIYLRGCTSPRISSVHYWPPGGYTPDALDIEDCPGLVVLGLSTSCPINVKGMTKALAVEGTNFEKIPLGIWTDGTPTVTVYGK